MRARDYGYAVAGTPGPRNRITDVPGVKVGHTTVINEKHNTGVTVLIPCPENPFTHKLPCASFVWNGFGKTAGLVQVDELGTLETPIAFTNTLNVGLVLDAMTEAMLTRCAAEGVPCTSVNPVVAECNDSSLNYIAERAVQKADVFRALETADEDFAEGAVGAGRGMTCHGLKGGIGSASRVLSFDHRHYTVGVLALTNHGRLGDLTLCGEPVGEKLEQTLREGLPDKGSCILILATDLPLSDRQLGRVIRRMSVGLARVGSFVGHGSGEVFIGFTTANAEEPGEKRAVRTVTQFNEEKIDPVFRAAAQAAEEAVLNSLFAAETVTGPDGTVRYALTEVLQDI